MARSTCVKSSGTQFDNVETTPNNSHFVLTFVQCRNCGGVISAIDGLNIGADTNRSARFGYIGGYRCPFRSLIRYTH